MSDDKATKPRICTYSGVEMWPFDPKPEMIRIEDIAHALSHIPRYSGHTIKPYYVGDHCLRVSEECGKQPADIGRSVVALQGLLHDAAEAYLLDIPSPLKGMYTGYREAENRLLKVIFEAFNVPYPPSPIVKEVDRKMLLPERRDLLVHTDWWVGGTFPSYKEYPVIKPLTHRQAKMKFLERFDELHN